MQVVEIRHATVPLSRFAPEWRVPSAGLDTTVVALVSDVVRGGRPVIGFGFGSVGRRSVGGLVRGRFGDRLLAAFRLPQVADAPSPDPFALWPMLMSGEKPGGHGERCVAVGCLDMALWDLAAKLADEPLYAVLARRLGRAPAADVPVYASIGYRWPGVGLAADCARLAVEASRCLDLGYTDLKIKIAAGVAGGSPGDGFFEDAERMDRVAGVLSTRRGGRLAVDAMNAYPPAEALAVAERFRSAPPWWFEDLCDPLDYDTLGRVAERYEGALAAGEALFSLADARNLLRYGGLRADRDRLVFDPVHCYGLPEYLRIVGLFEAAGWRRDAFWPHGGHLFALHAAAALGLGGSEVTPFAFQPLGGTGLPVERGRMRLPDAPGIGFEARPATAALLARLSPSGEGTR